MKQLTYTIEAADDGISVKDFLRREKISNNLIKKMKMGGICVFKDTVTVRKILRSGDVLTLTLPEKKSDGIEAMSIPLNILYEDDLILAVNKPRNMPTHPSKGNSLPTLANAVMGYYGGDFVFRSVNRLDRDTCGIVLIAKDQMTANTLSQNMKRGDFVKKYRCTVTGTPSPDFYLIDAPIRRENENSVKRIVASDGKRALTEYRVKETDGKKSVCDISLYTGRTHQIRVHMAYIGHPLIGDFLYGDRESGEFDLTCVSIEFTHPKTMERIEISVDNQK